MFACVFVVARACFSRFRSNELVIASALARGEFDDRMTQVQSAVDAQAASSSVDPLPLGGVVWSVGDVKKCPRIMEKLVFATADGDDQLSDKALATLDTDVLRAGTVLDTVRGMFICASMRHAVAVLQQLQTNAKFGHFKIVRCAGLCVRACVRACLLAPVRACARARVRAGVVLA